MSSTYGNIKDYAFEEHREAFEVLTRVFKSFSLHYFLIGAQARDVHFYQQGIKPARGTRDIDFAVMVKSEHHYSELIHELKMKGFEETKDPYRLNWRKGETVIDLLPFGEIEQGYTVDFIERKVELSVLGYSELKDELEEFFIDENQTVSVPVPPLHGIFILKLLSWDNKKPDRAKDLSDLSRILANYWNFVEDEAYEKHLDLFDDDFDTETAAAHILGRHLKSTLEKSQILRKKVIHILEEQMKRDDPPGLMLQNFATDRNKSVDHIKSLLVKIIRGIIE